LRSRSGFKRSCAGHVACVDWRPTPCGADCAPRPPRPGRDLSDTDTSAARRNDASGTPSRRRGPAAPSARCCCLPVRRRDRRWPAPGPGRQPGMGARRRAPRPPQRAHRRRPTAVTTVGRPALRYAVAHGGACTSDRGRSRRAPGIESLGPSARWTDLEEVRRGGGDGLRRSEPAIRGYDLWLAERLIGALSAASLRDVGSRAPSGTR
jgi:hypothetical protein